jgi:hypothetical protein
MQIQKYIPKPNFRTLVKISFVLLAVLSLYANYWQTRQWIAFRCEVNNKVVARLVSQTTCGELADQWQGSLSYAQLSSVVEANNDAARNEIDQD